MQGQYYLCIQTRYFRGFQVGINVSDLSIAPAFAKASIFTKATMDRPAGMHCLLPIAYCILTLLRHHLLNDRFDLFRIGFAEVIAITAIGRTVCLARYCPG